MFIDNGNNNFDKLRRGGIDMSPLTGLGVNQGTASINITPLRGLAN